MDDHLITITKICRMFKENNIHYQLMTNDQKQIVAVVMKYDKHEWSPLLAVVPTDNNRVKIDFMDTTDRYVTVEHDKESVYNLQTAKYTVCVFKLLMTYLNDAETEDPADKFTEIEDDLIAIPVQRHIHDYLEDEGMTLKDLAEKLDMSTYNLSMNLNDYDQFGKEFLIALAHATGTSDEYWINLQNQYLNARNKIEKIRKGRRLEND